MGGFRGVEDEEAAGGGVFKNVGDEGFVIEQVKVFAVDAFEDPEKRGLVLNDRGDFARRDAERKIFALFERGLGRGAEDGGDLEIVDEAAQSAKDRVEQLAGQRLHLIENDYAAGDAMELAAGAGSVRVEGFEKLDVGRDDERGVPIFRA